MATITIAYVQPVMPAEGDVKQICSLLIPTNSYVDIDEYAGTIWDTNVEGWGTWEGLAAYLDKISAAPTTLILFKAAARDGSIEFEESDAAKIEFFVELGRELSPYGFTVTVDDGTSE